MRTNQELEAEIDRLRQALKTHQEYADGFAQVVGALCVHYPNWRGRTDTSIGHDAAIAIEHLAKQCKALSNGILREAEVRPAAKIVQEAL